MNTVIINDCRDQNAAGRQSARASALLPGNVTFVGVQNDIEAAGNLIDIIDSFGEKPGTILVNVAPRNGYAKKWKNGTPFGYFKYKNLLIVSSVGGYTLSLVKKFQLTGEIHVLNIDDVCEILYKNKFVTKDEASRIVNSQFRSFDYLPRVAELLQKNIPLPAEPLKITEITEIANIPNTIWWIDNFGNCKTTLLSTEKNGIEGLPFYIGLKDVPDNTLACIIGSSGLGATRFIEVVCQGESAAHKLGLTVGGEIKITNRPVIKFANSKPNDVGGDLLRPMTSIV